MDGGVGFVGGVSFAPSLRRSAVAGKRVSLWRAPVSRRVSRLFMSVEDVSEETAAEVPVEELKDEAAEEGMEMADSVRPVPGRHRRGPKKEVRYQMADLTVGMEVEGSVRSTTNYGAFVDIGCTTDGLIHVSQLSSEYVERVEDIVKAGDTIKCRIISVNPEKNEFSLSMKPPGESKSGSGGGGQRGSGQEDKISWNVFAYDPKAFVPGKVVSVTEYGAFVDIDGPTDGMVHISEMADTRVESVDSILSVGDVVDVRVVEVDQSRRRISLSMVEWKEPGEEEAKRSANAEAIEAANAKEDSEIVFKSAFEIALEKAASKAKAKV